MCNNEIADTIARGVASAIKVIQELQMLFKKFVMRKASLACAIMVVQIQLNTGRYPQTVQ